MSETIQSQKEIILRNTQPDIRDGLSRYIDGLKFTDPADPSLCLMVVHSILAGQPARFADKRGAAIATEAGLARLGDRMDANTWATRRMKLVNVLSACLLCILIGALGMFLFSRMRGQDKSPDLGSQAQLDPRIAMVESIGAKLNVIRAKDGAVYVYFLGNPQPHHGNIGGVDYLVFKP